MEHEKGCTYGYYKLGPCTCKEGKPAISTQLAEVQTSKEMIRKQRAYIEAIQPFIEQQANLIAIQPVRYVQCPSGWEREIVWIPAHKELYDSVGAVIETIAREIFYKR